MNISFRAARNLGLFILLVIIIIESLFAYISMARNSERLTAIITVDQVKLRHWYDVAEIMTHAKDELYDYRLGQTDVVASADLLVNKALREIDEIKALATDEDEISNIDEITKAARRFKQAIYAFATGQGNGKPGCQRGRQNSDSWKRGCNLCKQKNRRKKYCYSGNFNIFPKNAHPSPIYCNSGNNN
jgi:hypothetical protein